MGSLDDTLFHCFSGLVQGGPYDHAKDVRLAVLKAIVKSPSFWKVVAMIAIVSGVAVPEGLIELTHDLLSDVMTAM
ncbi:MAG: hypothetical protein WC749_10285 [Dehalococcoidia bacterium]